MAGIYVHIPFCKDRCSYCDFFSGNQLYLIDDYVNAVVGEIELRKDYIIDNQINTIYLGGGTPSLLSGSQLSKISEKIYSVFNVSSSVEVTIECNPENISEEYVRELMDIGFNRISLGVQFMNDEVLSNYNRKHSNALINRSLTVIGNCMFTNLSVDMIYSVPGISELAVEKSVLELLKYDIKHFSAYELSISRFSRLYWQKKREGNRESAEDSCIAQYKIIRELLKSNDFTQYEVSNYALNGYFSRHNLGYWNLDSYLGIGTSAHSFNNFSRQWNHKNIKKYIDEIGKGVLHTDMEILTEEQRYNEYIMLKLRTFEGISKNFVLETFNSDINEHFVRVVEKLMGMGNFVAAGDKIIPREDDVLIADYLANFFLL